MLLQLYKVKRSHHGWNEWQNDRYAKAKEELLAGMTSTSFSTLERFPQRKMVLGEAQPVFLHDLLKQLLEQAMSGLDSSAKEHLLLHQFVADPTWQSANSYEQRGAPQNCGLRTVESAKLLTSLENEQHSRPLQ